MPKAARPVEVQRCPKCGFTYWSPIKKVTVWCPNHQTKGGKRIVPTQLEVIWDRKSEGEPPERTIVKPERNLCDV